MPENLGQRINKQLKEKNLRISDVSGSLNVSRQSLYKWINQNQISDTNLNKLSEFLGVPPVWLKYGKHSASDVVLDPFDIDLEGIERQEWLEFILQSCEALCMEWGLDNSSWRWLGNSAEVLGATHGELPVSKEAFANLLSDLDAQRFEMSWSNMLSNQGVEQLQCQLTFPSIVSNKVMLSLRMNSRRNNIRMVVCNVQTLSHYQKQLKRYEAQAKRAQKLSDVIYWEWDVARDRITGCPELMEKLGHSPSKAETNKEGIMRYLHPEDRAKFGSALEVAVEHQTPIDMQIRIVKSDGEHQVYKCLADVELDDNEQVSSVAGVSKNITEYSRLKGEYEVLERKCNDIQAFTLNEGSMIIDDDGHIIDVCQGVVLQLGFDSRKEIIGKHAYQLFDMHSYSEHLRRLPHTNMPLKFNSYLYDKHHQRQACKVRIYDNYHVDKQQKFMTVLLEDIGVSQR